MNTLHLHDMNIRYRLIMNICHLLNKASIQQRTSHVNSKSIRSSGGSLEKIECMKSYVESTYLFFVPVVFHLGGHGEGGGAKMHFEGPGPSKKAGTWPGGSQELPVRSLQDGF